VPAMDEETYSQRKERFDVWNTETETQSSTCSWGGEAEGASGKGTTEVLNVRGAGHGGETSSHLMYVTGKPVCMREPLCPARKGAESHDERTRGKKNSALGLYRRKPN